MGFSQPVGGAGAIAKAAISVLGLLTFGTITSISAKLVYELESVGRDGVLKHFEKPWFMTTLMFLGMSFCLPMALSEDSKAKSDDTQAASLNEPLLDRVPEEDPLDTAGSAEPGHSVWILMIPAIFDLIATALMNVGLLTVTASVYQMMRGAELLFAALFSVSFLKRHLNRLHLGGIAFCITGLSLVGLSSAASGNGGAGNTVSPGQVLMGMGLIILSQAVQAAQITFEDFFMSGLNISPLKIVAYEGVFGFGIMAGFILPLIHLLPGKDGMGVHEDTIDSLRMVANSRPIQIILVLDLIALCLYNITGMQVTGHLGAVSRTVLETSRTILVWIVGLTMFYFPIFPGQKSLGEPWTKYSPLQAFGFCWLVAGTMTYVRGDMALGPVEEGEEDEDRESGALLAGAAEAEAGRAGGPAGGAALAAAEEGVRRPIPGASPAVVHPTMAFQRTGQGIAIRQSAAQAASSFKSSLSLVSTSLQQSSLARPGSYLRGPPVVGTTDSVRGPFGRMSGVE